MCLRLWLRVLLLTQWSEIVSPLVGIALRVYSAVWCVLFVFTGRISRDGHGAKIIEQSRLAATPNIKVHRRFWNEPHTHWAQSDSNNKLKCAIFIRLRLIEAFVLRDNRASKMLNSESEPCVRTLGCCDIHAGVGFRSCISLAADKICECIRGNSSVSRACALQAERMFLKMLLCKAKTQWGGFVFAQRGGCEWKFSASLKKKSITGVSELVLLKQNL